MRWVLKSYLSVEKGRISFFFLGRNDAQCCRKWSYSSTGVVTLMQGCVCWLWVRMFTVDHIQEDYISCQQAEWIGKIIPDHRDECDMGVNGWQARTLYRSCNAEVQKKVGSGWTVFLQGCYVEMWVTLETEGLSLQEGCSERLAVLQEKHFAIHQVVRICTGWDQCNLECQVARWSLVPAKTCYHCCCIIHWWSC